MPEEGLEPPDTRNMMAGPLLRASACQCGTVRIRGRFWASDCALLRAESVWSADTLLAPPACASRERSSNDGDVLTASPPLLGHDEARG